MQICEEAWAVTCKMFAYSFRVMPLMVLHVMDCLKKVRVETLTIIMRVMVVMKILGDCLTC